MPARKMIFSTIFLIIVTIYNVRGQNCFVPSFPPGLVSEECLSASSVSTGMICSFTCDVGYILNGNDTIACIPSLPVLQLPTCQDIDECMIGADNCGANAICTNNPGSFICTCSSGFTGNGTTCTDIDECTVMTDNCDVNAICTNTPGSFRCACNSGYAGDGTICPDINECFTVADNCDANAMCTNTPGSFICACNSGYTGEGTTCTDIDECTAMTDNCDANAMCTNTPGSFICTCNPGYTGDGITCTDIDECTAIIDNCDANAMCTNIPGSFTCDCNSGLTGDGTICTDIDECTTGADNCDANAMCTNTPGSFTCVCNSGYTGEGTTCTDIDECTAMTDNCDANAMCTNIPGSFTCVCIFGLTGDGTTCTDIDECTTGAENCDANAMCTNTSGSFTCACNSGYTGEGTTCTDIDECTTMTDNCDASAMCTNIPGNFTCTCNPGYTGDGITCTDIDECTAIIDNCDANAMCTNIPGSFTCDCNSGLTGDGTICTDIDECTTGADNCDANAMCTNTPGSFTCVCNSGYTGEGTTCTDIDECTTGADNCDANAMCINNSGSFTCACNFGFSGNGTTCSDIDECTAMTDNCDANAICTNTPGSFICTCNSGYTGDGTICRAVDTFIVIATFLNKTYTSSLMDKTSSTFNEIAQELVNYIQPPLQDRFAETVSVVVKRFTAGSVIAEFYVSVDVLNRSIVQNLEHLSIIHATLTDIAEADADYIDPASIRTFSTVTCPAGTIMTDYGSVAMFENGAINGRANSTNATCPYYTEKGGQPILAVCEGDYIRPCNWSIPEMNCGMNLTAEEILEILQNVEVTADNAAIIAEELADITAVAQNISQEGLNVVVELLEGITGVNSTDVKATENVVEIADNIAALPDEQLETAEELNSAPSRVVLALEAQLAVVEVENGSSRFVETNVAAEVFDVTADDITQGYTAFMSVTNDGETISDEDFKVNKADLTQGTEASQAQATLFIPGGLVDRLSGRSVRLVFTAYRVPSLFQDEGLGEFTQNRTGFNRTVNSRIISASINNHKVENLSEPVRISFTPLNPNGTNAQCVFWDFNENGWSQRGCVKMSNDSSDRIECECNHLTNFGILMDIYGGKALSVQEDFILEIISYVGCCMSIWGLVVTILTYSTNKKLRDRKPNQILLSLSFSLLGLYIVFLVMISLDTERDVAELPLLPCSILAAFLHYFVLASIFWMGVEGYNMYNLFVRVLNTYLPWFMRKASLVAWGVPLLIVGITAGASRQYYAQTDFCFPEYWPLISGLLIPTGVVMILNVFIFVRVLVRLNKTVKGKQVDKTEKRQRLRRLQNAVCILILIGLTWSIGYLSIIQPASVAVQGIFTILNSLQGYFIFMLYCVRQPKVRMLWRSQFSCCLPKSFMTPSAANSTSGQTDSTVKNSSARLMAGNGRRKARLVSNSDSSGFRPETLMRSPPERLPRTSYD